MNSAKKKIYIALVVFGTITLILSFFIIYPLFKGISKNSQDFISQREEYALLKIKSNYLRDFEKFKEETKPNLEKINNLFVDPEMPIDFIGFLEKIARDSHLSITISPALSIKSKTDTWPSIAFHVNLTGTFSNLSRFLEKVETGPWLIEIPDLKIGKAEGENLQVNLLIKVYTRSLK